MVRGVAQTRDAVSRERERLAYPRCARAAGGYRQRIGDRDAVYVGFKLVYRRNKTRLRAGCEAAEAAELIGKRAVQLGRHARCDSRLPRIILLHGEIRERLLVGKADKVYLRCAGVQQEKPQ